VSDVLQITVAYNVGDNGRKRQTIDLACNGCAAGWLLVARSQAELHRTISPYIFNISTAQPIDSFKSKMGKGKKGKKSDPAKKVALQARKEAKAEKTARKKLERADQERSGDMQLHATSVAGGSGRGGKGDDDSVLYPSARANATLTLNQDTKTEAYLFGGEYYDGQSNIVLNELWVYNLKINRWKPIGGSSADPSPSSPPQVPPPRCAHSCVYYNAGEAGSLYVFGGERSASASGDVDLHFHYRDVWRFDIKTQRWEELSFPKQSGGAGSVPTARSGHAAVSWKNYMILFGGFTHESSKDVPRWYNDVYVLDLKTHQVCRYDSAWMCCG